MSIVFKSFAPVQCRQQVEAIFFFNPKQSRCTGAIQRSVTLYGLPEIKETGMGLCIGLERGCPQSLFAFEQIRGREVPVGVVVFTRTGADEMAVIYLAIDPVYCAGGLRSRGGLGLDLVEKVKEISERVVGIEWLRLLCFNAEGANTRLRIQRGRLG